MKKQFFALTAFVLTASVLIFSGCSDDGDTTPPVITVNGSSSITSSLNSPYTDAGASATDAEDGSVIVTVDNPVNKDIADTYTITYTATDAAGNIAEETRTVIVENDAADLAGSYTTDEAGSASWTQTITASTTINNRIIFSKFANYSNNNTIYANKIGSTIDFPSQTATGIGMNGCTHVFAPDGAGMAVTLTGGKYSFSIKFTDTQQAGGAGCGATGAVSFEDIFTQQ